jgi:hypothetical protein
MQQSVSSGFWFAMMIWAAHHLDRIILPDHPFGFLSREYMHDFSAYQLLCALLDAGVDFCSFVSGTQLLLDRGADPNL